MKGFNPSSWRARKVTIAGLGTFGGQVAAARFFAGLGAIVTVTDIKGPQDLSGSVEALADLELRLVLGGHDEADFTGADLVVASPAIPEDSRFLQAATDGGVEITHEMDIFFQLCRAPILGVTGSNGKSTTTALAAHILRLNLEGEGEGEGRRVWLGGNIGVSLLGELDRIAPGDLVVLELSSFQLEDLGRMHLSPHAAVVTNLSPNHLDRHGTFENYALAKRQIALHQGERDLLILNRDDANLAGWEETDAEVGYFGHDDGGGENGVFIRERSFVSRWDGKRCEAHVPSLWKLPGDHNLMNLAAACAVAARLGVALPRALEAASSFRPLPHRLEAVGTVDGVEFFNDSIATTPESACAALSSFTGEVVLIAGGYDKGVDLSGLAREAAGRVKALVAIGQTGKSIARAASRAEPALPVFQPLTFDQAVRVAFEAAGAGGVVLLSPACASYDMFGNFQERGEAFRGIVSTLKREGETP